MKPEIKSKIEDEFAMLNRHHASKETIWDRMRGFTDALHLLDLITKDEFVKACDDLRDWWWKNR